MLGGGAGHMQDMNNRMRDNKKLRKKRKKTKEKHTQIESQNSTESKPLRFNQNLSQYNKVKKRIRSQRKKDERKTRVVILFCLVIIVLLFSYLLIDFEEGIVSGK